MKIQPLKHLMKAAQLPLYKLQTEWVLRLKSLRGRNNRVQEPRRKWPEEKQQTTFIREDDQRRLAGGQTPEWSK